MACKRSGVTLFFIYTLLQRICRKCSSRRLSPGFLKKCILHLRRNDDLDAWCETLYVRQEKERCAIGNSTHTHTHTLHSWKTASFPLSLFWTQSKFRMINSQSLKQNDCYYHCGRSVGNSLKVMNDETSGIRQGRSVWNGWCIRTNERSMKHFHICRHFNFNSKHILQKYYWG